MGHMIVMAAALLCASAKPEPFTVSQQHFWSAGQTILIDVYAPACRGPRPPILVLHGAGGMLFDGPEMSRVSRALASAGYTVYQVHYFDRTHTWFARQAVLLRLFPTWLDAVHDAVEWVRSLHHEARSVGIFGYSLGAFAAIEEARRNPAVGAVVAEAGGFWHGHPEGPTGRPLPPMLIIHGTNDRRVPYEKYTKPLITYLSAHGDPFAKRFFPGEGHDFTAAANEEVRKETIKFFSRHLAP